MENELEDRTEDRGGGRSMSIASIESGAGTGTAWLIVSFEYQYFYNPRRTPHSRWSTCIHQLRSAIDAKTIRTDNRLRAWSGPLDRTPNGLCACDVFGQTVLSTSIAIAIALVNGAIGLVE